MWAQVLLHANIRPQSSVRLKASNTWRLIITAWSYYQLGAKWNLSTGNHVKFWTDPWITHNKTLRSCIHGPLPQHEETKLVSNYYHENSWHLETLPFHIPTQLYTTITNIYMPIIPAMPDQLY